jgi:hypothetical protein
VIVYSPSELVVTLRVRLVAVLTAVTVAFGTTAPLASATRPVMSPVAVWAAAPATRIMIESENAAHE